MTDAHPAGTFDYIIVGAGSAGCVLANRLSADPENRVLLLEAGEEDRWIWLHIPVGYLFAIGNPRADWMFHTEPEPGLGGRALPYPRGRALGGSSAINAMIYMRGQAADYDGWRDMGLSGWGWDDVLQYFLKSEDHAAPPNRFHRKGGEWHIDTPRVRWKILDAVRDAAAGLGIAKIDDFNAGDNEGSAYFHVNQKHGLRFSLARAFLRPARGRPNLTVLTGVEARRVLTQDRRATGVEFLRGGMVHNAKARAEVILAAGAVASPCLLERSGIGQGQRLAALGIGVVADRPGVGENMQDHLQIRPVFRVSGVSTLNTQYWNLARRAMMGLDFAFRRRGPLTMAPSQLGIFTRSDPSQTRANLQFHIQPLSLDAWGDGLHRFDAFTASVCNLRPTSRGTIHLSADRSGPSIQPNYLSTPEDQAVAVASLRLARRLAAAPELACYAPREEKPGTALQSDEALLDAAGRLGTTIFHPVGTARMGLSDDPMAVTDTRLRVIGVDGLRVVDASIMPRITSGNTNAPTVMIAEKGAAMILEDKRRNCAA